MKKVLLLVLMFFAISAEARLNNSSYCASEKEAYFLPNGLEIIRTVPVGSCISTASGEVFSIKEDALLKIQKVKQEKEIFKQKSPFLFFLSNNIHYILLFIIFVSFYLLFKEYKKSSIKQYSCKYALRSKG